MCAKDRHIGYSVCIRETAIDLFMDGINKNAIAMQLGITYPTICKWIADYELAGYEVSLHLT
jgi:transposase